MKKNIIIYEPTLNKTYIFKLIKVNNMIFQGDTWQSGYKLDYNRGDIPTSTIDVIECHLNEGPFYCGTVIDENITQLKFNWIVLSYPLAQNYKIVTAHAPKNEAQQEYYYELLNKLQFDDIEDIKNICNAIDKMIVLFNEFLIKEAKK